MATSDLTYSASGVAAEATYIKATKAEMNRDFDNAFRLYISAAESFLHLSRSAGTSITEKEKIAFKANAGKALQRAEKIKAHIKQTLAKGSSSGSTANLTLTPVSADPFSQESQYYVLKKGGIVHGLSYDLWDDPARIQSVSSAEAFDDPNGQPALSSEQLNARPVWKRPRVPLENCAQPHSFENVVQSRSGLLPTEILQHIVTDCSVCASISACLGHAGQFNSKIAESTLYPAGNGCYHAKFFFNGGWRRVIIDDKLPHHPTTGKLLCMSTTTPAHKDRDTIWPSLLEKAYMKLMGGYDFPGSNSSIDIHALAGWIPDHIEIKSPAFEREKTWSRMVDGFASGQCIFTLGTGPPSEGVGARWGEVVLLPSHSYAVVGITNESNDRILTILDSWRPVKSNNSEIAVTGNDSDPLILRIPWSEVLTLFDGIYLSWDPQRWDRSIQFHGMWKPGADSDEVHQHLRLKFTLNGETSRPQTKADMDIYFLLSRHVVDCKRTSGYTSLYVQVDDDLGAPGATETNKVGKSCYTNSTHILAKSRIHPSQTTGAISVFASYDGKFDSVGYTLTALSKACLEIEWEKSMRNAPFAEKINAAFTGRTAGGNSTYPTFMMNPQYHLRVHALASSQSRGKSKANVVLTIQAGRDVPVNVTVVRSQGERVFELVQKEITANSGPYSYGLARVAKNLQVGDYTIILSSFEPLRQTGPFTLLVESSHRFGLEAIPQEGAGMYSKTVRGVWISDTAAGSPGFDRYASNPMFKLHVPLLTQIKVRLQLERPPTSTALNVGIYEQTATDTFPLGRNVCTSGGYDDSIAGVATPQVALAAGTYWLVPSTYHPGVMTAFRVIVYTSISGVTVGIAGSIRD